MAILQWLWGLAGRKTSGVVPALALAAVGALLVCVPIRGLPAARWLASVNADFSIPLTAALVSVVWGRISGRPLLDGRALGACWLFGAIAGVVLYPMALGLSRFDPYVLGWDFSALFAALMITTILLLLSGNRFGFVLMAVILAYNLNVLESPNLWDYAVDPFYVFASLAGVGVLAFRKRLANGRQPALGKKSRG